MKQVRKILCLLLVAVMCLGALPTVCFAASGAPNFLGLGGTKITDNGELKLTPAETWKSGGVWSCEELNLSGGGALEFDFWMGGGRGTSDCGNGADGITVSFSPERPIEFPQGEQIGFYGKGAFGVEFDTWYNYNRSDPREDHVAILNGSVDSHLAVSTGTELDNGTWHHTKITYAAGKLTVELDGAEILAYDGLPSKALSYVGIAAATGAYTNVHLVRKIKWNGAEVNVAPLSSSDIPKNQFLAITVDETGFPLSGASVTYNGQTKKTDADGRALFSLYTVGTPQITASLDGYLTWSNENSNFEKSEERYLIIPMYSKAYGGCKLNHALYSNTKNMLVTRDLLTKTKNLGLPGEADLVGELDFGNFYLDCQAMEPGLAASYLLYQGTKRISESTDGFFELNVKNFKAGGSCVVRVKGTDGTMVDTPINLTFSKTTINKGTGIDLGKGLSVPIGDNVPFFGGSTIEIDFPTIPVDVDITEDKIRVGFNTKNIRDFRDPEKRDDFRESLDMLKMLNRKVPLGKAGEKKLKSLMKKKDVCALPGGKFDVSVIGYGEADWGSSEVNAELYVLISAQTRTFGFTTWVVVVPVTVQAKGTVDFQAGAEGTYHWDTSQLDMGLKLELDVGIDVFGGVGVGKHVGAGAYGGGNVDIAGQLLGTRQGVDKVDLTGQLGVRAYLGPFTYEKPFAYHTWHLYTRNNVNSVSVAPYRTESDGILDASSYYLEDFSYLAAESSWHGESVRLQAASGGAKTELHPLLTDTYRNAQPVLVSDGEYLYGVFLRGDTEGKVQVVWTRYDGTSWSEPAAVDGSAGMEDAPQLCADEDGNIWLAYARTDRETGDSFTAYAKNQTLVVGQLYPDGSFEEMNTYTGDYVHGQKLFLVHGVPTLVWLDSRVTDNNSVLNPERSTICRAVFSSGWSQRKA